MTNLIERSFRDWNKGLVNSFTQVSDKSVVLTLRSLFADEDCNRSRYDLYELRISTATVAAAVGSMAACKSGSEFRRLSFA